MVHFSQIHLTRYKGYWRTVRDGKRVGIHFTYNNVDGKIINEVETQIDEL